MQAHSDLANLLTAKTTPHEVIRMRIPAPAHALQQPPTQKLVCYVGGTTPPSSQSRYFPTSALTLIDLQVFLPALQRYYVYHAAGEPQPKSLHGWK